MHNDIAANVLLATFGVFWMVAAFTATGMRGAFSSLPPVPISRAGRILAFVFGFLIAAMAISRLFAGRS